MTATGLNLVAAFLALSLVLFSGDVHADNVVYRCESNGQSVLTDRPTTNGNCQLLGAAQINTYQAISTVQTSTQKRDSRPKSSPARQASDSIANEQLKAEQRCERLQLRLSEIDVRLRNGYTLKQGEQLRERQRVLQQERKIERCR